MKNKVFQWILIIWFIISFIGWLIFGWYYAINKANEIWYKNWLNVWMEQTVKTLITDLSKNCVWSFAIKDENWKDAQFPVFTTSCDKEKFKQLMTLINKENELWITEEKK